MVHIHKTIKKIIGKKFRKHFKLVEKTNGCRVFHSNKTFGKNNGSGELLGWKCSADVLTIDGALLFCRLLNGGPLTWWLVEVPVMTFQLSTPPGKVYTVRHYSLWILLWTFWIFPHKPLWILPCIMNTLFCGTLIIMVMCLQYYVEYCSVYRHLY